MPWNKDEYLMESFIFFPLTHKSYVLAEKYYSNTTNPIKINSILVYLGITFIYVCGKMEKQNIFKFSTKTPMFFIIFLVNFGFV